MKKVVYVLALLVVSTVSAWSQCTDYKWPQNQAQAEKKVDAIKAAIKDQNYKAAAGPINWMLVNVPQWHSDLYVYAAETYEKLATEELDPTAKMRYVDSLLLVYDMRIKTCGEEEYVLNRKAYAARKFLNTEKSRAEQSLAIFDKTFEVSGNNVLDNNLIGYIDAIRINNLSEDQIMSRYNKMMGIIAAKMKKSQEQNKTSEINSYNKVLSYVDSRISKMVKANCEFSKKYFEPLFVANPNDVHAAKQVFTVGVEEKCASNPTWFQAAELLHSTTPDFANTKELCDAYIFAKNFDKATPLLEELKPKAAKATEKAWIEILNGDVEFQKGNKAAARELYRKALTIDANSKEAYERIGDLYVSSAADCSKVAGSAEEKLIYIAAFQIYLKSGNRDKMEQALNQYPTASDLQKAGWKTGEQKKIACWIDETVTIKARKE